MNANTTLYAIWCKRGDTDFSNTITIEDSLKILSHLADLTILTGVDLIAADVNRNGTVDIQDSVEIQKYLAQLPSDLDY